MVCFCGIMDVSFNFSHSDSLFSKCFLTRISFQTLRRIRLHANSQKFSYTMPFVCHLMSLMRICLISVVYSQLSHYDDILSFFFFFYDANVWLKLSLIFVCFDISDGHILPLKSFPCILLVYMQCVLSSVVLCESGGSVLGKAGQSALMNLRPVPE